MEVAQAFDLVGLLLGFAECGQEQRGEDGDDGGHEAGASGAGSVQPHSDWSTGYVVGIDRHEVEFAVAVEVADHYRRNAGSRIADRRSESAITFTHEHRGSAPSVRRSVPDGDQI